MTDSLGRDEASFLRGRAYPGLLAVLCTLSYGLLLRAHLEIDEPLGADGFYYAVQLRELLASGRLYYPAAPIAFFLLAPFAAIFGPILGVKIGAPLYVVAAIPLVAEVVRRVTGDKRAALVGALER